MRVGMPASEELEEAGAALPPSSAGDRLSTATASEPLLGSVIETVVWSVGVL